MRAGRGCAARAQGAVSLCHAACGCGAVFQVVRRPAQHGRVGRPRVCGARQVQLTGGSAYEVSGLWLLQLPPAAGLVQREALGQHGRGPLQGGARAESRTPYCPHLTRVSGVLGFPTRRELGDCFIWGAWSGGGGGGPDETRTSGEGPARGGASSSPHPVLLHQTHTLDVIQVALQGGMLLSRGPCCFSRHRVLKLCKEREPVAVLGPQERGPTPPHAPRPSHAAGGGRRCARRPARGAADTRWRGVHLGQRLGRQAGARHQHWRARAAAGGLGRGSAINGGMCTQRRVQQPPGRLAESRSKPAA